MTAPVRPYLSPAQIAERLQVSDQTVLNLIHAGALPAHRIGRSLRVDPADFDAYLDAHRVGDQLAPRRRRRPTRRPA